MRKKLLLEEADAREVAEYIGMDVQKRGANYFVLCPGHSNRLGKEDSTIGNCVLYKNGYKCFACNPDKIIDIFQMVPRCNLRHYAAIQRMDVDL